jgi:hypothetical protein
MRIRVDRAGVDEFRFRTESREHGDPNFGRRYYCAAAPYRVVLVCRNGLDLLTLVGQVVDGAVGNDEGWRDFVREGNAGKGHTKITLYRVIGGREFDRQLSDLVEASPLDEADEIQRMIDEAADAWPGD